MRAQATAIGSEMAESFEKYCGGQQWKRSYEIASHLQKGEGAGPHLNRDA